MENFYKKVKRNRKKLKEAGFRAPTIHRWEYGKRIPSFDIAIKLALILDMNLRDIPFRRIEVNKP
jgi:DNA-binding XRE family transcriptional regulator